jgi:hypothetical protein
MKKLDEAASITFHVKGIWHIIGYELGLTVVKGPVSSAGQPLF